MFTSTLITLGAVATLPQAMATVFMTAPIGSTLCHGGQTCQVAWQEDTAKTPPLLADWGTASVGVWVGNQQQQTELQRIQDGVNVATTGSITFTPNPSIGPNANVYFIRFTSDSAKDPNNPQFPAESFSAKFTLDNMSGTFNSTVAAQISGATSAPISTPGATPTSTSNSSSTTTHSTTSSTSTKSSSSTAAGAAKTGAAMAFADLSLAGAVAPIAAVFALLL